MTVSSKALPPPKPPGPLTWIQENLFNNWYNSLLTIVSLLVVFWGGKICLQWIFFQADWRPIAQFPILFMVGQYPREQLWRVGVSLAAISFLFGLSWGVWGGLIQSFAVSIAGLLGVAALLPFNIKELTLTLRLILLVDLALIYVGFWLGQKYNVRGRDVFIGWLVASLAIALALLPGFPNNPILPRVPTSAWGGLLVTFVLAVGGIVLSFPIGILLALGRRSALPVVKVFCTVFIETIRGVPLVTILFMFSLILQVFLPAESRLDRLLRALMGITIFSAAYMAENVRGGLQAIHPGQIEASKAVGMNNFQITLLIVLPQALRAVIPAIVGQFISLFKDTTLVIILGINELLGIGKAVINSDPEFIQMQIEVYLFVALIFWVFSYAMSAASRQLEASLGVGERY
jgi:general L-amino acid transport system permease protein